MGVLIFAFAGMLSLPFVSAYGYFPDLRYLSQSMINSWTDFLQPFIQVLFGGYGGYDYMLFEKLLIFLLLASVIYLVLGKMDLFSKQKAVRWIVTVIVPLLGVRFLDFAWVNTIITEYQVLAIALTAILPFIIYFFFLFNVAGDHAAIRKIGWVFFLIVYIGLWATAQTDSNSGIYFWTAIVSFLFLLFDGTIYKYYYKQRIKDAKNLQRDEFIARLKRELQDIMNTKGLDDATRDRLIRKKQKDIEYYYKNF